MSFPSSSKFTLVVAAENDAGEPDFVEVGEPATIEIDGSVDIALYWTVVGGHSTTSPGSAAESVAFPELNGSTFGIVCFPAHSAGKFDVATSTDSAISSGQDGDPAMHSTDTIDYEVILSGKVDIELPGGKSRTLEPGSLLVMGGVPHAWKNHYDEDCIYASIAIGAQRG